MDELAGLNLGMHRIKTARERLAVAEELYANNHYIDAVSKAYYAIFQAARAALAILAIDSSKHSLRSEAILQAEYYCRRLPAYLTVTSVCQSLIRSPQACVRGAPTIFGVHCFQASMFFKSQTSRSGISSKCLIFAVKTGACRLMAVAPITTSAISHV